MLCRPIIFLINVQLFNWQCTYTTFSPFQIKTGEVGDFSGPRSTVHGTDWKGLMNNMTGMCTGQSLHPTLLAVVVIPLEAEDRSSEILSCYIFHPNMSFSAKCYKINMF